MTNHIISRMLPGVSHFGESGAYSPEHNPIERRWKEVPANVTRNHRCKTIYALLANVEHFLKRAQPYPGAKPSLAKATTPNAA